MMNLIDCAFLSFSRVCFKFCALVISCTFVLACQPVSYWTLIIYDRNSVVTETFSINGYESKQACQLAAKKNYSEQRFLCVLEDDLG